MSQGRFSEVIKEAKQAQAQTGAEVQKQSNRTLPISKISLIRQQPRRYFDPVKMQELTQSVKKNGILEPLLVRPLDKDNYELVAGERRLRAAKEAQLEKVPVVIREMDEHQAFQVALVENLQREDLNPLEQAEGIVGLLAIALERENDEIPSLLYKMHNEAKGKITPSVWGNSEGDAVVEVFESLGLNWKTFVKTRLPLLKLPSDLLEALRQGKIEYTKASELSRLKDDRQREKLLQEAIDQNLSLTQIKERLKQLNFKRSDDPPSLKSRFSSIYTRARKSKVWDEPKKQKQLEKLVTELETKFAKLLENS